MAVSGFSLRDRCKRVVQEFGSKRKIFTGDHVSQRLKTQSAHEVRETVKQLFFDGEFPLGYVIQTVRTNGFSFYVYRFWPEAKKNPKKMLRYFI